MGLIGRDLDPELIVTLCDKMQLGPSSYNPQAGTVRVTVPPTRSDVLHPVDVIEDVAIAYGYNKVG